MSLLIRTSDCTQFLLETRLHGCQIFGRFGFGWDILYPNPNWIWISAHPTSLQLDCAVLCDYAELLICSGLCVCAVWVCQWRGCCLWESSEVRVWCIHAEVGQNSLSCTNLFTVSLTGHSGVSLAGHSGVSLTGHSGVSLTGHSGLTAVIACLTAMHSEQWCWSGGRGILTELYLCYSIV